MKKYKVIKRNGETETLDVSKIKKVIQWATLGLPVNSLELESQMDLTFRDGMTSKEIHSNLISNALKLTNVDKDENMSWRFAASRLLLMEVFKDSAIVRGYKKIGYQNFYKFVVSAVKSGLYDPKILQEYEKEDFEEMEKEINLNYDFGFDYAGMNLLSSRYLIKENGRYFELPQHMYVVMAMLLAVPEKKEDRLRVAKEFYHVTASRQLSLATPIVLNLRKPNGSLASCFIGAMDDSLNSIYYTLEQIAQISKRAGGVGMNLSRIRSEEAAIQNIKGASGGVVPWVKLINDTAVAVNQTGSRAGAVTVALDVWHRDIENFLEMQSENGDQRNKCYDIFPQIVIPDIFMKRVTENKEWTLFDPHEVNKKYDSDVAALWGSDFEALYQKIENDKELEFNKKISAKELFKKFLKTVVETGMPYVTFKDSINRHNPNKHAGMIGNGNLCMESFSNFKPSYVQDREFDESGNYIQKSSSGYFHTCNLASINLAEIHTDEQLEKVTRAAVKVLDNALELTMLPIPEATRHNNEYKILGIGTTGLNDWIVKNDKTYLNSKEMVSELYEKIAFYSVDESANLSKEKGKYSFYEGSDWSKGILFGKDKNWFTKEKTSLGKEKWYGLIDKVQNQGIRHGGLLAIAPNTSTSLLMGCTSSVLPVYSKFFLDKASKGTVPIIPPYLKTSTFFSYIENKNIDQNRVVEMVSEIQKWVDQGISMELTLNINEGIKAKDIYNLYTNAWKSDLKTVYYIRSIAMATNKDDCVSCAN